jgi:hypothetical protein
MSSTNRGGPRNPGDYYVTPIPHINTFLREFKHDIEHGQDPVIDWTICPFDLWGEGIIRILDPCAGGDDINSMSYPAALAQHPLAENYHLITVDIREDSPASIKANFLTTDISFDPDIVITNPPFELALNIIEKSLQEVRDGGLVIMLLRLNFLESADRFAFFNNNMPNVIYPDGRRMGFWPEKVSTAMLKWCAENDVEVKKPTDCDSVPHAHFVFQKGTKNRFAKIRPIYTRREDINQKQLFHE